MILGKNELFGLEDIVEENLVRAKTITCLSKRGKCYLLNKDYFILSVNRYRYSQAVIEERMFRHQLFSSRMI